ncbi:MAG: hypothetical protein HQL40_18515 [Alphaproteobacteria bacterium]|nr:hypothetical protein [Alphaproteobacteria bacterium]
MLVLRYLRVALVSAPAICLSFPATAMVKGLRTSEPAYTLTSDWREKVEDGVFSAQQVLKKAKLPWEEKTSHEKLEDARVDLVNSIGRLDDAVQKVDSVLSDTNSFTLEKALREADHYKSQIDITLNRLSPGGDIPKLIQENFDWVKAHRSRVMGGTLSEDRKRIALDAWDATLLDLKSMKLEFEETRGILNRMYIDAAGNTEWIAELILLKKASEATKAMRDMVDEMKGMIELLQRKPIRQLAPAPPTS